MSQDRRYNVVRKLTNGRSSEIFLGTQRTFEGVEQPIVFKRLQQAVASDPQSPDRLIHEGQISMTLNHGNVVRVVDVRRGPVRPFLILELIDGWDLGWLLQRCEAAGCPLPADLGAYIVSETCRALIYAHSKTGPDRRPLGIVHRHVTPRKVLVSEHGEVKLAGFGKAEGTHQRDHASLVLSHMQGATVVENEDEFQSPEYRTGTPVDGRSDVFSLGALLKVVSTGMKPADASADIETHLQIIARAMKVSRDDRYQAVDELLSDLEILLSGYKRTGQTKLQTFLKELGRRDGVRPIGQAPSSVDDELPHVKEHTTEPNTPAPSIPVPSRSDANRDVFISYSSRDSVIAQEICSLLEARGATCWIAPRDVLPGRNYDEEIVSGILNTRAVVILLSDGSNESPHVKRELEIAINEGSAILPLRIQNVRPGKSLRYFLAGKQWVDAWQPPIEHAIDRIVAAVVALTQKGIS